MDHQPTTWVDDDPSLGIDGTPFTAARMGNLETGVVSAHARIAAPCMRVHTANVVLANAVVTVDLDNGDRVLLTAQANTLENGVYTYDSSAELYVRDANEIYAPGRLFPVVTKTQLGLDEDYTAPELWACTDAVGADRFVFTRVTASGGGVSVASVKPSERVGSVLTWTSNTIPADCLLANGQPFTQVAFPELYAYAQAEVAAGNTLWTVNAAAGTATVPNLADRFIYGKGAKALGARAGAETHPLTPGEIPTLNVSAPYTTAAGGTMSGAGIPPHNATIGGNWSAPTTNTGGATGAAHNNMPPYVVLAFIIKAKSDPASVNPAKRVKGRIDTSQATQSGPGWSSVRTATGRHTVTFSPAFAASPNVQMQGGDPVYDVGLPTASQFSMVTKNSVGADAGAIFDFVAEDQGLGLEATMDVEPWHVVGAAGEPAFQNGWVGQGAAPDTARFRKTPDGKVHLDGRVKSGTVGLAVFTLPLGYRPPAPRTYAIMANGVAAYAWVDTNGNVNAQTGANTNYGLNGISFFTD